MLRAPLPLSRQDLDGIAVSGDGSATETTCGQEFSGLAPLCPYETQAGHVYGDAHAQPVALPALMALARILGPIAVQAGRKAIEASEHARKIRAAADRLLTTADSAKGLDTLASLEKAAKIAELRTTAAQGAANRAHQYNVWAIEESLPPRLSHQQLIEIVKAELASASGLASENKVAASILDFIK